MATANRPDYAPSRPPQFQQGSDADTLAQWMFRELRNISQANLDKSTVELRQINAPPPSPREGMIVDADGVQWNPGSGAGIYAFVSGAWLKL